MRAPRAVRPAPKGWTRRNGPMALAERLGRWPDLLPFHLAASVTLDLSGPASGRATSRVLDSEFYALAASVAIQDGPAGFTPDEEGFGGSPNLSPQNLWAQTDLAEEGGGRRLSNQPVSIGAMWGRGDRPFLFPAPFILPAGRAVIVEVDHFGVQGAIGTSFHFVLHGFKRLNSTPPLPGDVFLEPRILDALRTYSDRGALGRVEPFWYSLMLGHDRLGAVSNFIPGLTEAPLVTIADADFLGLYIMADFYDSVGSPYIVDAPNYPAAHLVRFVIDEGRRRLDDRPMAIRNVTGISKRWMKLPYPLVIRRGQTFSAIVTPQLRQLTVDNRWVGRVTVAGVRVLRGGR